MTQQSVRVRNPQVSGGVAKKISDSEYRLLWIGVGVGLFLLIRLILAAYEGFMNVPPSNYLGGLSIVSALFTLVMLVFSYHDRQFFKVKTGIGWSSQQIISAVWTLIITLVNCGIGLMIYRAVRWPIFGWEPIVEYHIWVILLIVLAMSRTE